MNEIPKRIKHTQHDFNKDKKLTTIVPSESLEILQGGKESTKPKNVIKIKSGYTE